jgi:hypothetical protein
VADENDAVTLRRVAASLRVHLRHEGAGGVDRQKPPAARGGADGGRDPVCGEDDRGALGNLVDGVDEHGAVARQLPDDVRVVDDLLADVDGRTVMSERATNRLDGPLDACAVPPRRGQKDPLHQSSRRVAPLE